MFFLLVGIRDFILYTRMSGSSSVLRKPAVKVGRRSSFLNKLVAPRANSPRDVYERAICDLTNERLSCANPTRE